MATKKKLLEAAAGAGGVDSYWINLLGGTSVDVGRGVAIDSSDNIIVTGYTNSDGAGTDDALVAKYDSSGTLLWDKTLGGANADYGYGVAIDSSDNIIVTGYTQSDGAGGNDVLVVKYNSSGTLLWDRTLGGASNDLGFVVAIDSSDNIIVVGYTGSDGAGNFDVLVAKYNSSGTLQWDRTLGGANNDIGYGVAIDSSDNIIVVGYTASDGAGGNDVLVVKYNSSGTLLWQRTLGGTGQESGYGVAIDSSDNIIVVGVTPSDGAGGQDVLVAKCSSSGTLLWDKTLGGASSDYGQGVAIDSSDNIIVTAYTPSDGAGGNDVLVAKLPPDGTGDGTYGSLVYEDAVLTFAVAGLTDAAAVLTDAPAVLTDAAAVLTDQAAVLTEEFFEITP
jgi:uncharacterized delta-60 repeat protein